jgi:thiamine-monophosphate kinase
LRAFWGEGIDAIIRAATVGDDYQIAFTADPAREDQIRARAKDVSIARIGTVLAGQGVDVTYKGQQVPVAKPGYRHF